MLKLNQLIKLTPEIQNLLINLEGHKTAFSVLEPTKETLANLRKKSILKSALYSARIEGNELTEETLDRGGKIEQLEVQNLYETYTWLAQNQDTKLDLKLLCDLHRQVTHNLRIDAGHFRIEQTAIFDSSGNAIYLTPPPQDIKPLLNNWLIQINHSVNHPLIQGVISHYQFEKIHPFVDGNGRVGRLIFTLLLYKAGFHYADLIAIEKLIEASRRGYYHFLESESRDLTKFVHYFLNIIDHATREVIINLKEKPTVGELNLLPRRGEILAIIKDHSPCSADFIYRRFLAVPPSTIRYDLKSLQKIKLIRKLGTTRGALYEPIYS